MSTLHTLTWWRPSLAHGPPNRRLVLSFSRFSHRWSSLGGYTNVRDPEPLAQGTTSHLCLETATSVQPAVPSGPCPGSESSPVIPSGSSQAGSDPSHLVYGTP
ncbi:hypothetical protein BJV77DRAFT_997359 [Russula vinacea]|nr:hypothetical protein BJV77DRAFT_997359 [Russula vinacea]